MHTGWWAAHGVWVVALARLLHHLMLMEKLLLLLWVLRVLLVLKLLLLRLLTSLDDGNASHHVSVHITWIAH